MDFTNYEVDGQMSIFDFADNQFKIKKPIRLIELFAGVGSQAMALRDLGADFEHYRVVEFDKYAIASYNAIHNTDFPTMDITKVSGADLGITNTDKYCYIMTYSFPCQDLSLAGLGKGMSKDSGTRSGLLWEVERLLNESEHLPQVLLMENVPQVHSKKNMDDFQKWIEFLESKGYTNLWQDMNAKDYGIPQSRNRTFMVSILGNWQYKFPKPITLELRLKDMLEDVVDEKYYLTNKATEKMTLNLEKRGKNFIDIVGHSGTGGERGFIHTTDGGVGALSATDYKQPKQIIEQQIKCIQIGNVCPTKTRDNPNQGRVYDSNGISPTLTDMQGGGRQPMVVDEKPQMAKCIGGVGEKKSNGGTQYYQQDRIYQGDIALAHPANLPGGSYRYVVDEAEPKLLVREATKKGYDVATVGDTINFEQPNSKTRRGRVGHGVAQTINTAPQQGVVINPLKDKTEYGWHFEQNVYDPDGITRTVKAGGGSGNIPKVFVQEPKIEVLGNYQPSGHDASRIVSPDGLAPTVKENHGTVTATVVNKPIKLGYIPYPNSDKAHQSNTFYSADGISPTIDTCSGGNLQPKILVDAVAYDEQNQYIRKDGTVGTLTTDGSSPKHNNRVVELEKDVLRIRKLTPKECWRLMNFTDEDFHKAEAVNSRTQLYKQAGNSIVKNCLVAIFGQMLEGKEDVYKEITNGKKQ